MTQTKLNSFQFDELVEKYVEIVVDRMNTDDLIEFVTDSLTNRFGSMKQIELRDYIVDIENSGCPEDNLYDELVDNVTNETVLDTNNTGGKF